MASNGSKGRVLLALGLSAMISGAAVSAVGRPGSALGRLQPGLWEVRELGAGAQSQSICVSDPALLVQLRHGAAPCSRLILSNDQNGTNVHYTCP